ncbi:MarR family transcriptional regulator [Microbacterium protaetiae]|uniref:MarR family transcriptional regulator n=1 Tax=Microbacterium protaetiae TaxID=2509458 RepID=A0A4P6ERJ0_9MICO|nr:MarR family transcriptional regulator [Microbacterium protaetiae]QAY60528.1 MarR family transcriptional regulator [Microbacterium protaetiae]
MTTASVSGAASHDAAPERDPRRDAVRDLEGAFSLLFTQLRHAYAQASEAVSPGMIPGTFKVFTVINQIGPVSASTLAERMTTDKGMISRSVAELEGLGLIERTPDATDGRIRLISVTPFGQERLRAIRFPFIDRLEDALSEWPMESIERLSGLLGALANNIIPQTDFRGAAPDAPR